MNLYSRQDVAVSHVLDLSMPNWLVPVTVLAISVVLAVTAGRLWVASIPDGKRRWYAVAIGIGATAALTQGISLWIVVRQLEQYRAASGLATAVVVVVTVSVYAAVRSDLERRPHSVRLLVPTAVLGVPVVVSAAITAVILVIDGWFRDSTAVILAFLALGALGVLLAAVAKKKFWPRFVAQPRP